MPDHQSFVSVGSVVKKIHESRPDLNPHQILRIIQAATFKGKIDEEKATELAKIH